ncbi:MAG: hypothetical protein A3B25_03305 [Candidatus Ryanbacteria bacterium RIFCSPLOWO2_01_FULL_48_26]|uniref:Nucleotidyl transferase domain-containing protein n=1 Tax=Candidatus Ryanbacteria bacterium RIFCSPLOWO2_01_FULL_48_26 TaxID=1802126 RepID=A0A1G2GSD3_9BACT|nr:MAG: hypothetical protein A3B25_03305 [Candidatus Ryanbacteria bacterium RIFCSPLOWO2_01_FULL_48_26]
MRLKKIFAECIIYFMQIVVPMAGNGKRFADAGYDVLKPLIEVEGKPMIEHVVNLFPGENDFVFICSEKHLAETPLRKTLQRIKPKARIVSISPHKLGPVQTILLAGAYVRDNEPTLVSYCDFSWEWNYTDFLRTLREKNPDSASVCYTGFHPHLLGPNLYAGVRVDEKGYALEVQEKHSFTQNKMDTWFQAGVFYFKSGGLLKKYCKLVSESGSGGINGEYYGAHLFNFLLQDGLTSFVYKIPYWCNWGTPEDLEEYNHWIALAVAGGALPVSDKANDAPRIISYWRNFLRDRKSHQA